MGDYVVTHATITRDEVTLAVVDRGGEGPPLLLLHGLAGSSRELLPTADALADAFHVLLMDQRGHGRSTRRPADLSREAFMADVIAVLEELLPGQRCTLVGQSMGAHTALLVAAARPDLVRRLVMLEGHAAGDDDPDAAAVLGRWFATWPTPFPDTAEARAFLGDEAIVDAWIADLEPTADGLVPPFDADVMERAIAAVHAQQWEAWESLQVPVLAVFAAGGMFSAEKKDELIRRRPATDRADLDGGSHDAHLDAFEEWIAVLRKWLGIRDPGRDGPHPGWSREHR